MALAFLCARAGAQTQPSGGGGELLQNKAAMPGYGVEAYRIVSGPDEIISVLRNGAVVICKRVASPVAAVRGYCETGGVYEGQWLGGGLSHLLEHLVAGGSSERRTETQNKQLLQQIGNDSNAYTTYDHTAFFVNTTTAHFAQAADLVTGWMLGAKITYPEYTREYQVVQRELERNKGNPDMVFYQLMQENRYQVSPARVPVIGYQEVIQGLSRDDVYSYYKMAYQPNNMVFAVAANLDPEEMLKTMRGYLSDAKPGRAFSHDIAAEPPVLAPRTIVATFPRLGQARLNLAFPSVRETDAQMYALDLLAEILGGGESSILVEDIRDRRQLCHGLICEDDTPPYVLGSFDIEMELDAGKVAQATQAVLEDIEKIKAEGIDEDRMRRAAAQIKIAHLKELQTSQDVAATMGTDFLGTGDAHFSDEYVKRIGAVTPAQLHEAAREYLDQGRLLTTVMLPREAVGAAGLPKAEDLLRGEATTSPSVATGANSGQVAGAITKTVLDNGLIVLHRRITTTPLVSISMFALGGITAENASNNGLGQLAMATAPRGTQTRTAEQIADFFDLTGGDLKTTCGNNTWYWEVTCTRDDFARTMEVYGDVVNHPAFDPAQVAEMKARALAQIAGQDASWDGQAFRYFKQQFFGPKGSPYQFTPLGSSANVSRLSAGDLKSWYQKTILTAPRVIAIFGDVDNDTAVAMARKYFSGGQLPLPPKQAAGPDEPAASPAKPTVVVDRVAVQKTEQELAGVVIGFESHSRLGEPNEAGLIVAQCLTGGYGYPTGYIFETLRGQGWSYEAASQNVPGRSRGLEGDFVVYAACDPRNVNKVTGAILQNMARLQGTEADIQADWFTRCKDMITTAYALETETPEQQAQIAATEELFALGYDYHEGFSGRINAVTLGQVQELGRTRLGHCVVTVCTPAPEIVDIHPGPNVYESFPAIDLTPRGVRHDVGGK
ncbi:MAG: pitrilysin family protein [Tepidisphaeraceae bacterium]